MAQTYTWGDLVTLGSAYVKGMPLAKVTPQICDFVSSQMYTEYPWKNTITNTANGMIPLLDSKQDYSAEAPNIMRPLKAELVRTDVTPNEHRDLQVMDDLNIDLYPRSWYGINVMSLQAETGLFRLQSAVQVPTGTQLELRVKYQINPSKVTSLTNPLWFDDRYAAVALEGMLYWVYKLSDNPVFTEQYTIYKQALDKMEMAENFGAAEFVFPYEPMGIGRDQNAFSIFGW